MVLAYIIAGIAALLFGYYLYVLIAYKRLPDDLTLTVEKKEACSEMLPKVNTEYSVMSYNIGFGAYESDYSFFMDGGKYSRAFNKKRLTTNLNRMADVIGNNEFTLLQEVDVNSSRAYHFDEKAFFENHSSMEGNCSTYAVNYDSPYLLYPFTCPIGKSKSGIMTFSKFRMSEAKRKQLPIQEGAAKLMDLDRCLSVNRIPTENGHELVLINLHLSAYTTELSLSNRQVKILLDFMYEEYKKGNYTIAGGDFNKDLIGDSSKYFVSDGQKHSGVTAFPYEFVPNGLIVKYPYVAEKPVATCRNAHEPYKKDSTYVQTIDGFVISKNVRLCDIEVIDTGFAYSDHNPVVMKFELMGEA